jgi:hypothetical protein
MYSELGKVKGKSYIFLNADKCSIIMCEEFLFLLKAKRNKR